MDQQEDNPHRRVFEDEAAFLRAEGQFTGENGKSLSYVVWHDNKHYWVWAAQHDQAMSLVARYLNILTCTSYYKVKMPPPAKESEVLALFNSLSPPLQERVRRHLIAKNS